MKTLVRWTRVPLALLVAFLVLAATVGQTYAAPGSPGDGGQRTNAALERGLQEARQRLSRQDQRLNWANDHAARIDAMIAKLKAKGKDTAALEQAVAAFRSKIGEARQQWEAAKALLANPAGFDAQGKVTNADQARNSLQQGRDAMNKVTETAKTAYRDLRKAVETFRKANREANPPAEPEQP